MPASTEQQWKPEEDNLLRQSIKTTSLKDLQIGGRTRRAIESRACLLGLKSATPKIKHSKDESFWSVPNALNSYYAGYLAADGCVHDQCYSVSWAAQQDDRCALEAFKAAVRFTGDIKCAAKVTPSGGISQMCTIRVANCKRWMADLATNFSVIPRKSRRLAPPNVTTDFLRCCYLIGYIDGDGCIHADNRGQAQIRFVSASRDIIAWLQWFIESRFPFQMRAKPKHITTSANGAYHHYSVYGMTAIKLFEFLRHIDVPKLARKWESPTFLAAVATYRQDYPGYFTSDKEPRFDGSGNIPH